VVGNIDRFPEYMAVPCSNSAGRAWRGAVFPSILLPLAIAGRSPVPGPPGAMNGENQPQLSSREEDLSTEGRARQQGGSRYGRIDSMRSDVNTVAASGCVHRPRRRPAGGPAVARSPAVRCGYSLQHLTYLPVPLVH